MTNLITSSRNERVKFLKKLRESQKFRRSQGVFIVEGIRELTRALSCGFEVELLVLSEDLLEEELRSFNDLCERSQSVRLSRSVFDGLVVRKNVGGLIGVFKVKGFELSHLKHSGEPFLIAVEGIEKPGNLGAILRTADAVGADGVVLLDCLIDVYNPNVVRASLGAVFSVPVVESSFEEFHRYCLAKGISIFSAYLNESVNYTTPNYSKPSCIVLGAEDVGLQPRWQRPDVTNIMIPMQGMVDSLNVSVACAVISYEIRRQRSTIN